jgi:hypothetical protein
MADEDCAIFHRILWIAGNPPTLAPAAQSLKHGCALSLALPVECLRFPLSSKEHATVETE